MAYSLTPVRAAHIREAPDKTLSRERPRWRLTHLHEHVAFNSRYARKNFYPQITQIGEKAIFIQGFKLILWASYDFHQDWSLICVNLRNLRINIPAPESFFTLHKRASSAEEFLSTDYADLRRLKRGQFVVTASSHPLGQLRLFIRIGL